MFVNDFEIQRLISLIAYTSTRNNSANIVTVETRPATWHVCAKIASKVSLTKLDGIVFR